MSTSPAPLDPASLSALIGLIYDAAEDPHAWPALLASLGSTIRAGDEGDDPAAALDANAAAALVEAWLDRAPVADHLPAHLATRAFTGDEQHLVDALAPHLGRALTRRRQWRETQATQQLAHTVLERLPVGIALLDEKRHITYSNASFNALCGTTPAQRARVVAPLLNEAAATETGVARTLTLKSDDHHALSLLLLRLPQEEGGRLALFAASPGGFTLDAALLRQQFGVTEAEARLAQALAGGLSAEDAAQTFAVSINTIRTQLKSLLAKTGSRRQGELMARLFGSAAAIAAPRAAAAPPSPKADPPFVHLGTRRLAYSDSGPRDGIPLILMHGLAGSRHQRHPDNAVLHELGVRLLIPERPGMGRSDPLPGRTLPDWADDVRRLADTLGIERFAVLGYSLGSGFALACAAALPTRVTHITLISPVAPVARLADLNGMLPMNRLVLMLARFAPALLPPVMRLMVEGLRRNPDQYVDSLINHIPPDDVAVLRDPRIRGHYIEGMREAVARGEQGLVLEQLLAAGPWPLTLTAITQPCVVWHGEEDRHVPADHGRRLAAALPNARLQLVPAAGHYLLFYRWRDILAAAAGADNAPPPLHPFG